MRPFYKFYKPQFDIFIENGGWHFSSVKTVEKISTKISSFAEQQYNSEKYKSIKSINEKIKKKIDLFERGYKYKVIQIDDTFPKYLNNNKEKFSDFIYKIQNDTI